MSWDKTSREKTREYHTNRRASNREIIKAAKQRPCADCGKTYHHFVMDLDHVRGEKCRAVSQMTQSAEATLRAEIAKCDVVCSNCHRIRTHRAQMLWEEGS